MDLLRRAFSEHPVASWAIVVAELVAFFIVVFVVLGRVFVPFGALAYLLVGAVLWRRRQRETGPTPH